MKRGTALLFILLCLLLACPAFALANGAQAAWEASCEWITLRDTFLHTASYSGDGRSDAYAFRPARILPGGTSVMVLNSRDGMHRIAYWQEKECYAWVPEADVGLKDPKAAALRDALANEGYPGKWGSLPMTLHRGDTATPVRLVTLGSAYSLVYDGTQTFEAPTCDLDWATDAEPAQQLAVITAPRTGRATLRISAGDNARELMQCPSGTLVIVLTPGDTYTQIVCEGETGYLLTSALSFLAVSGPDGVRSAVLGYRGRTDGDALISFYQSAGVQRRLAEFPVGTPVTVFREGRIWTLVEIAGMRGYVRTSCLP